VHSPLLHGGTRELGIDSLGALDLAAAAAGPRLAFDLSLTFRGRDRGMFAGLLPEPAGLSPLLALVSADDPIWSAARLDLAAAARAAMQAAAVWSSQAPAELAADLRQQLGIDLVDDLLAHATGEIMWLTAPGAAAHDDQPPGAADFALAIRLRDEAAFRQGFRTLLQHSRGFLTRLEDLPHDGATIWRCGGPFTASDCHVAIGAGMFCLAVGPRAVPRLRAWLDAAGAGALRGEPALPPEFAGAQRTTADGLRSAGRIDLGAALRLLAQREPSPLATLLRKLVEVPSLLPAGDDADADGIADALQEVVAVLGNRKLAAIQCLAGHGDGRWWCRMLW
jgi:hypothetical protein